MSEQPESPEQNGQEPRSAVLSVSVRAWLAILITVTICGNWTANMIMAAMGITSVNIVIPEPLYSAFTMVLGIYFGQAIKK
jgi:hypothetical protein